MIAPQVRFSDLKVIGTSAEHYQDRLRERYLEGGAKGQRPTSVGLVAHALVLNGARDVEVWHGKTRQGKAWDAFRAEHEGKVLVNVSEWDAARAIAEAVERHPDAMAALDGARERELPEWTIAGRKCGGRPDVIGRSFITDLKTAHTSSPALFRGHSERMCYHAQLAWYLDGYAATGGKAKDAFIVAVEQRRPHVVTVFELTPRALEVGRKIYSLWFEQLRVCEESDSWPGYAQSRVELDVADGEELDLEYSDDEEEAAA